MREEHPHLRTPGLHLWIKASLVRLLLPSNHQPVIPAPSLAPKLTPFQNPTLHLRLPTNV